MRAHACMSERASAYMCTCASACLHVCACMCAHVRVCARTHPTHPLPPSMYSNYFYAHYVHFWILPLHVETALLDTPFSVSVLTLTAQNERLFGPDQRGCLALQCIELCQRVIQV